VDTLLNKLSLKAVHPSWLPLFEPALLALDPAYLEEIAHESNWLPGPQCIFNAFSLPLPEVNYILFGESPYPRPQSANGFAFWDNAVNEIWTKTGLSVAVNRATSLRNIIKMLLIVEGALSPTYVTQEAIAKIDKSPYVKTLVDLFNNFQKKGILLLNASLVFRPKQVRKDAAEWHRFTAKLMEELLKLRSDIKLLLFGKVANEISNLPGVNAFKQLVVEHPYNISFITNPKVLEFFAPLHLLLLQ
jgi:uracil-DNA glycosylase